MENTRRLKLLDERKNEIIDRFSQNMLVNSPLAPMDGGIDGLWERFHRALMNQMSGGEATFSRYAIWANTVRDNILEGLKLAKDGQLEEAEYHLVRAANSLAAFCEVQAYFDPFELREIK
jgi:hypothetical protein